MDVRTRKKSDHGPSVTDEPRKLRTVDRTKLLTIDVMTRSRMVLDEPVTFSTKPNLIFRMKSI